MTLTPDASNEMLMLSACIALSESQVDARFFLNHELVYYGHVVEVDLLADTIRINEADADGYAVSTVLVRPSEFNRIEIY